MPYVADFLGVANLLPARYVTPGRLEVVQLDIAKFGGKLLEPRPVRPLAADDEGDVVAVPQLPRGLDHQLDSLLVGDIARIERELARPQPPFAAIVLRPGWIGGKMSIGPIAQLVSALRRHALGQKPRDHLRADRRDPVAQPLNGRP